MNDMTKLLIALSLTVSACGGAPDASVSVAAESAGVEQSSPTGLCLAAVGLDPAGTECGEALTVHCSSDPGPAVAPPGDCWAYKAGNQDWCCVKGTFTPGH